MGLIPESGRSHGGGNTFQYSCQGNSIDGEAWQATVHGIAKSWTQLSMHTHTTSCYIVDIYPFHCSLEVCFSKMIAWYSFCENILNYQMFLKYIFKQPQNISVFNKNVLRLSLLNILFILHFSIVNKATVNMLYMNHSLYLISLKLLFQRAFKVIYKIDKNLVFLKSISHATMILVVEKQ